jgi:hypothetical protein
MRREYDFSKGKRGAIVTADGGKTRITIRLDNEILEWFRKQVNEAGGGNYQSMINNALREALREGRRVPRVVVGPRLQPTVSATSGVTISRIEA